MSPDPAVAAIQGAVQRRLDDLLERRLAESRRPMSARGPAPGRPLSASAQRQGAVPPQTQSASSSRPSSAPQRSARVRRPSDNKAIPWDHWAKSSTSSQGPHNMSASGMADDMTGKRAPGPAAYSWEADLIKPKAPVQSIHGKLPDESDYMSKRSPGPCNYSYHADTYKSKAPVQSIHAKLPDESFYMSKRSPGPAAYSYNTDTYKKRAPVQSLHGKLPDESFYMAKRSPGPGFYTGAAACAKKQSCVDSTKKRTTSCTFRGPERFSGTQYELHVNGALNRYG